MITLGTYQPLVNQTIQVPLLLRQGFTEIVNDTNFALTVSTADGQCLQPPNIAQLYRTPVGGGVFSFGTFYLFNGATIPGNVYLTQDLGPAQIVTVNQYESEGELVGRTYPYPLMRSVLPMVNIGFANQASASVASMASTLTASLSGSGAGHMLLQGIDLQVDQESTAHAFTLSYGPFIQSGSNFSVPFHSMTATTFQYSRIFNPPIPATALTITATVAGVAGATARGALNLWGVQQ